MHYTPWTYHIFQHLILTSFKDFHCCYFAWVRRVPAVPVYDNYDMDPPTNKWGQNTTITSELKT